MSTRQMMRVQEVADYIGQSPGWTRIAMADGTIPNARKVRGRWMVPREDVDAWIDGGRKPAPEPEGPRYAPFPEFMTTTKER